MFIIKNLLLSVKISNNKEMYFAEKHTIREIVFTAREVDIVSCILHSRGAKKIAAILSLSPKTVDNHIQNIMRKIGCNSQERIIDFIEESSELNLLRKHYLDLLINVNFQQQLEKISYLSKKSNITCHIFCLKKDILLNTIIKHLKCASITIKISVDFITYSDAENILYILSDELIDKFPTEQIIDTYYNKKQEVTLITLDKKIKDYISSKEFSEINIIDFSKIDNYYESIFNLLKNLLPKINLENFITKFEKLRNNIVNMRVNTTFEILSNTKTNNNIEETINSKQQITGKLIVKYGFIVAISSCFIISFITMINFMANLEEFKQKQLSVNYKNDLIPKIHDQSTELTNFLSVIKNTDFSADNVTKEQMYKNYSLVKQMEKMLSKFENQKIIQKYFDNIAIISSDLINYLYSLHNLASYYTYNEHDGEKAREILKHAKVLAENYIINRSKIPVDFDKLAKEETYTELAIIKDLPEIYTKIIYLLGRTYIYQNKSQDDYKLAKNYFELSKYLGNALGLFEGYLSSRSGLGILRAIEVDIALKNEDSSEAQKKLHEVIELYKKLKEDEMSYSLNYRPNNLSSQTIIPAKDVFNKIECSEKIINCYTKLVLITKDLNKKKDYLLEITKQFVGTAESLGILTQLKALPNRKIASIYNSLGNTLLQLHNEPINLKPFISKIVQNLELQVGNKLEIMEQVFMLAEAHSRNTDYTKADAYDGLAIVYQKQIDLTTLGHQTKKQLSTKISELKNKSNFINKQLKRTVKPTFSFKLIKDMVLIDG